MKGVLIGAGKNSSKSVKISGEHQMEKYGKY